MTNVNCIADLLKLEATSSSTRHLKVSYASRYPDYLRMPAIHLKGLWLEAAGFTTGTALQVQIMEGCMILTAIQE